MFWVRRFQRTNSALLGKPTCIFQLMLITSARCYFHLRAIHRLRYDDNSIQEGINEKIACCDLFYLRILHEWSTGPSAGTVEADSDNSSSGPQGWRFRSLSG